MAPSRLIFFCAFLTSNGNSAASDVITSGTESIANYQVVQLDNSVASIETVETTPNTCTATSNSAQKCVTSSVLEYSNSNIVSTQDFHGTLDCSTMVSDEVSAAAKGIMEPLYGVQTENANTIFHNIESNEVDYDKAFKELRKKEIDRLYKQQKRKDPFYREQERLKAKNRMKVRRANAEYREMERVRDRIRRHEMRQLDAEARQRERERDRIYKQNARKH